MSRLLSIQVGRPQSLAATPGDLSDKPWRTAIFKGEVAGPVWVGVLGLEGDGQANLRVHGGPDKAVCVYPGEHFDHWRRDLGCDDVTRGAFGENFTTDGLVEPEVCIGDVWRVGDALLQVSQPRQPCSTLARRWRVKDLAVRVQTTGHTGWYLRVLEEGIVTAGDAITLVERRVPEWTIARANDVMHHRKQDREAAAELAAVEALSDAWKDELRNRFA